MCRLRSPGSTGLLIIVVRIEIDLPEELENVKLFPAADILPQRLVHRFPFRPVTPEALRLLEQFGVDVKIGGQAQRTSPPGLHMILHIPRLRVKLAHKPPSPRPPSSDAY